MQKSVHLFSKLLEICYKGGIEISIYVMWVSPKLPPIGTMFHKYVKYITKSTF